MRRKPLTIARLRAWAETKSPHAIIGLAGSCSECPLATYLTEQGMEGVRVTVPTMSFTDGGFLSDTHNSRLSLTLIRVIHHVDHTGYYAKVSREEFLRILDKVQGRTITDQLSE